MSLADYPYDALDDLLYDWFCWQQRYRPVKGYGYADQAFALVRSPRQWQDTIEVIEESVLDWRMMQTEASVDELDADLRLAIYIELYNRQGPAVWRNPRAQDQQPQVYVIAKTVLSPILRRRGVLDA